MKNVDHSIIITYLDWQGWVLVNVIFLSETPAVSGGMREHDMIILTSPLNQERVAASRNNICRGKRKELLVGNSRNVSWTLHHVVVGQTDHEAWSLLVIVDVILHLTHSRLTHRKPSNGRMSHWSSTSAGHYSDVYLQLRCNDPAMTGWLTPPADFNLSFIQTHHTAMKVRADKYWPVRWQSCLNVKKNHPSVKRIRIKVIQIRFLLAIIKFRESCQ